MWSAYFSVGVLYVVLVAYLAAHSLLARGFQSAVQSHL